MYSSFDVHIATDLLRIVSIIESCVLLKNNFDVGSIDVAPVLFCDDWEFDQFDDSPDTYFSKFSPILEVLGISDHIHEYMDCACLDIAVIDSLRGYIEDTCNATTESYGGYSGGTFLAKLRSKRFKDFFDILNRHSVAIATGFFFRKLVKNNKERYVEDIYQYNNNEADAIFIVTNSQTSPSMAINVLINIVMWIRDFIERYEKGKRVCLESFNEKYSNEDQLMLDIAREFVYNHPFEGDSCDLDFSYAVCNGGILSSVFRENDLYKYMSLTSIKKDGLTISMYKNIGGFKSVRYSYY